MAHNKLWKILKDMGILDHLTSLLRNLYAGQEVTELDVEQQTGSKLGKEYIRAVYCYRAYFTYMQSAAAAAKSLQLCPTLCNPIDGSPPGSPIPGILQPRTLQWVALPSPMRESEVAQSYLTLSDPVDCSPPGSSIHGILQATVLEWGAIAFSDGCGSSKVFTTSRQPFDSL